LREEVASVRWRLIVAGGQRAAMNEKLREVFRFLGPDILVDNESQ